MSENGCGRAVRLARRAITVALDGGTGTASGPFTIDAGGVAIGAPRIQDGCPGVREETSLERCDCRVEPCEGAGTSGPGSASAAGTSARGSTRI